MVWVDHHGDYRINDTDFVLGEKVAMHDDMLLGLSFTEIGKSKWPPRHDVHFICSRLCIHGRIIF
jgi:hypothetical protein